MDGERRDAAILQLLGQFHDDLAVVVPSQTRFHRHGQVHGLDHGTGDFKHQGDVAQHAGATALARDLLHGAAPVDVDEIGVSLSSDACRLDHRVHIAAIDLDGCRMLARRDGHLLERTLDAANQRVGADELGIDHIGPLFTADEPERLVGDVLHRSQHHRKFP